MEPTSIRLTAPEISSLWTQYMFDTMSICFLKYALEHIRDQDILDIYKQSLEIAEGHVEHVTRFLKEENFPIPKGFTDEDVNIHAPRLFQDPFYALLYVHNVRTWINRLCRCGGNFDSF
ncbi:DUF3231 family protein [Neobacillus drentensis]|uniref:DUF3231 family protein n=1 Tax=Neobacillus drentensis TaxID=220684 RepID=UPI00300099AD